MAGRGVRGGKVMGLAFATEILRRNQRFTTTLAKPLSRPLAK